MKIDRRHFLEVSGRTVLGLTAGISVAAAFSGCARIGKGKKPNIIFILIDDLGWKDVAFMGSGYYETPHIDRLASQGMVFTDAYTCGPNCAPTRASLLSGQYTPRHGVLTVRTSDKAPAHLRKLKGVPTKTTLDSDIVTIAEVLKSAGYVSASMGKWHLGNDPELGPVAQGFDVNIGGWELGRPNKSYFSPYNNPELPDGPEGEYLTDRLTDEALAFIETNRERPFFLYLPHYAVHGPLQAKEEMIQKYREKAPDKGHKNPTYAAMIESTDSGIGQILNKLDELGLTDNTVVFFYSDNGGVENTTSMEPLRGHKGQLYEGGVRVPLAIRWPGVVKPGTVSSEPVTSVDFYPTLMEIAGGRKPGQQVLDGESLVGLLKGSGHLDREAIFWHFPCYLGAGSRNYLRQAPAGAVRHGDWKLIEFFEDGHLDLYNLKDDIGEKNNLAGKLPEKAQELHNLLKDWRKSVGARIPTEPNPEYDPGRRS